MLFKFSVKRGILKCVTNMPVNWLGFTYTLERNNGQCIIGPPADLTEPEVPKEIMIAGLPKRFGPAELVPLLSAAGTVYKIRLYQNFSGLNRGFCYVSYTSFEASCKAMTLNGLEVVRGQRLKVFPSKHIRSIAMRHIDKDMNKATIQAKIADMTKSTKFNIRIDGLLNGLQNATIEFPTPEEALNAIRLLNSFSFMFGQSCNVRLCNGHDK
ncbi:probable RNA-binding protein 46 [Anopheles albimanus]|uniref:probable RNA-binding protein 46 n=1 Tax=Anopheles albimanus TaxID=7167 RepID=UPI0016419D25|nr:probable RNA-binding protein 46 [Anopheles albimanus]